MKEVKKTSKEDIVRKTTALNNIATDLQKVEDLRSSIATRLDILFSEDCSECLRQAGFIKSTRQLFQQASLQGLIRDLYSFNKALEPNAYFPHLDDIK